MRKKNGISLVVLVITIIVMIILAGTIILTLNSDGVIDDAQTAVKEYNEDEVNTMASLVLAEKLIEEAHEETELEPSELEEYIKKELKKQQVDIDKFDFNVTLEGVEVTRKNEWIATMTADGVPIPKGFVASEVPGEDTKAGGLVIYEGTTPVTVANVDTAILERNQYVWVPVTNFTAFIRKDYKNTPSKVIDASGRYNNLGAIGYWEVMVDLSTNMPLSTMAEQNDDYMTATTLAEVQAMYKSVKEHGGFYIARYEAGINTKRTNTYEELQTNIYSVMGKIPYTFVPWASNENITEDMLGTVEEISSTDMLKENGGAVSLSRNVYPKNNATYGVASTLVYGVQWDRVLAWWQETSAVPSVNSSTDYGNFKDKVITSEDLNSGAKYAEYYTDAVTGTSLTDYTDVGNASKESGTVWSLTTGALEDANVNNIYDFAGNIMEWTMEGNTVLKDGVYRFYRVSRGGNMSNVAANNTSGYPVPMRTETYPHRGTVHRGFRVALYIKPM